MSGIVRQRGTWARMMAVAAAAVLVGGLVASTVEARPGRGGSVGSRGAKTYSAPPSTNTAPGSVAPIQRSTAPAQAQRLPGSIARPQAAPSPTRGFGSLVMGGLLGAGLFGLLSGAGLFSGLSGLGGMLGLLLQVALIGGLVWLAMSLFRRRSQPALASGPAAGNMMRQSFDRPGATDPGARRAAAGTGGQAAGRLQVVAADYDQFEALLSKVHNIYGQADRTALSRYVTPEMMGYFADELDENDRRGLRSEVSDPKLLQGDLAESWTEGSSDYATVAMRYALLDATIEVATGKVVDGSRTERQELTELWTFRRPTGSGPQTWRLSAIQQPG